MKQFSKSKFELLLKRKQNISLGMGDALGTTRYIRLAKIYDKLVKMTRTELDKQYN